MRNKSIKINKGIIALDFFCGCGGVTHGMRKARRQKGRIDVLAGFDNDPSVKYPYERNNKGSVFYETDLVDTITTVRAIKNILKDYSWDLLIFTACAPCQPFSMHNRKPGIDSRRSMMSSFIDIVEALPQRLKPSFILCENVSTMNGRGKDILKSAYMKLDLMKYDCLKHKTINAANFGVPQNRKRLIFIAGKRKYTKTNKFNWSYFIEKYSSKIKTVEDAIGNGKLPKIKHGHKINKKDPLHVTRELSDLNLKRIKSIKKPGGNREMWPADLQLNCYKNHDGHKDIYGRMPWSNPAPTLTCRCNSISNGRFGHPEQDRAISLREAAILQTMDKYRFEQPIGLDKVATQIGNAVPPKLAEKLSKFILEIAMDP